MGGRHDLDGAWQALMRCGNKIIPMIEGLACCKVRNAAPPRCIERLQKPLRLGGRASRSERGRILLAPCVGKCHHR